MLCPYCGNETASQDGRCGVCHADLSETPTRFEEDGSPTPDSLDTVEASSDDTEPPLTDGSLDDTDAAASDTEGSGTAPRMPTLAPGQAFSPRYQVTRMIGEGGMGAVYEAFDKELGLSVALKVILSEKMGSPKKAAMLERRFKRELLLGRKVTHKNVIRIHDIGEIDGIKYITMPYIDGSDLSHVLKEAGGKLPVSRALRIARTVLSGLTAAHDAGVVHRDLKPANIMIDADDEAYIMDFGIATAATVTEGSSTSVDGLGTSERKALRDSPLLDSRTQQGRVVGTVQYMAPEQARGQTIDKRADLYAFGLILYDMLVGRHREQTSASSLNELTERMKTAPATVRSIDSDLPEALEKIIDRCVQPDPDDRYPHPHELQAALDRLDEEGQPLPITRRLSMRQVAALVSVVVAALVGAFVAVGPGEPPPPPDPVSVVIADLENRTNDAAFDGTLEPMLRRVLEGAGFITAYDRSRIGGLGVPRPDRLDAVAARELAVQQGLGVVHSGAIDPQGSGYTISFIATQTVTGEVITSAQDRARSKDQVLDVATGLIARVRNALGDDMSESAQQFAMASLSATSLDVVSLYAAAMEAASANRFDEARQNALSAVELDPDFGIGYLVLANASENLGRMDDRQRSTG